MNNKTIPYLSFEGIHGPIAEELHIAARKVVDSNWYILGEELKTFENRFKNYISCKHSVGVNSGLDALVLALRCLDIGTGDEVIVASNAYIACWNAISIVGAKIIPVAPNMDTFNIDPAKIVEKISTKTKAIMAVHLYGQMCDMESIMSIAKSHELFVIEDNAQAQGCTLNGRKSGSIGDINATSFYPGKNLGALGDAGIISTNNEKWAKKAVALRNYGSHIKYENSYVGMNSRMDEMQAAFLTVKLQYLDQWNQARRAIASKYISKLPKNEQLLLPKNHGKLSHVSHIFCIRTKYRNELQEYLLLKGVQTMIHYPIPPHLQKAYAYLGYKEGSFPIAEAMAEESLSLPIYPGLSDDDINYISELVEEFFLGK